MPFTQEIRQRTWTIWMFYHVISSINWTVPATTTTVGPVYSVGQHLPRAAAPTDKKTVLQVVQRNPSVVVTAKQSKAAALPGPIAWTHHISLLQCMPAACLQQPDVVLQVTGLIRQVIALIRQVIILSRQVITLIRQVITLIRQVIDRWGSPHSLLERMADLMSRYSHIQPRAAFVKYRNHLRIPWVIVCQWSLHMRPEMQSRSFLVHPNSPRSGSSLV